MKKGGSRRSKDIGEESDGQIETGRVNEGKEGSQQVKGSKSRSKEEVTSLRYE